MGGRDRKGGRQGQEGRDAETEREAETEKGRDPLNCNVMLETHLIEYSTFLRCFPAKLYTLHCTVYTVIDSLVKTYL